jgi:hypothetical protein
MRSSRDEFYFQQGVSPVSVEPAKPRDSFETVLTGKGSVYLVSLFVLD